MSLKIMKVVCQKCKKGEFEGLRENCVCNVCDFKLSDDIIKYNLDKAWEEPYIDISHVGFEFAQWWDSDAGFSLE